MYQLMIHRKNSKKGFTLVEVIVVLVILAILAAIMIPAMTGWIDRARNRAVLVEARTVYLAAQTLASEAYAVSPFAAPTSTAILSLAGVSGGTIGDLEFSGSGVVTDFSYTKNGVTASLSGGSLTVPVA